MKLPVCAGPVLREKSYEALFYLTGLIALSMRPSLQGAFEIQNENLEMIRNQEALEALTSRGLVESRDRGPGRILRQTELGRCAFDGGRRPEEAWNRFWDAQWRLVVFDLPREARGVRSKFWRWLRANHFGRFQGSVWITPDPIPEIQDAAGKAGLESTMFMVFTGQVDGTRRPKAVAAEAWDFAAVNDGYRSYQQFAKRVRNQIRRESPSRDRLNGILREDRKEWWRAVRIDPLLPRTLCPRDYGGFGAWEVRQKFHRALFGSIDPGEFS